MSTPTRMDKATKEDLRAEGNGGDLKDSRNAAQDQAPGATMNEADRPYLYPGSGVSAHPPAWISGRGVIRAMREKQQRGPDWISRIEALWTRARLPECLEQVKEEV